MCDKYLMLNYNQIFKAGEGKKKSHNKSINPHLSSTYLKREPIYPDNHNRSIDRMLKRTPTKCTNNSRSKSHGKSNSQRMLISHSQKKISTNKNPNESKKIQYTKKLSYQKKISCDAKSDIKKPYHHMKSELDLKYLHDYEPKLETDRLTLKKSVEEFDFPIKRMKTDYADAMQSNMNNQLSTKNTLQNVHSVVYVSKEELEKLRKQYKALETENQLLKKQIMFYGIRKQKPTNSITKALR